MVAAAYLALTCAYSVMTPAWETNDEAQHVQYAQFVLEHRDLPPLSIEHGHESHQPPLYYVLLAGWQRVLGIDAFVPSLRGKEALEEPLVPGRPGSELMLDHDYDEAQRQQARDLHVLRTLSIALGLSVVLVTFAIGRLVTGRDDVALAASAFVALLPKANVVFGAVTNDALVVPLASLALLFAIAYVRGAWTWGRGAIAAAMGVALGLAALTKLNALPLAPVLLASLFLAGRPFSRRALHAGAAAALGVVVASPWLAINAMRYGDPLARDASLEYLRAVPGVVAPVGWTDAERFLYHVPGSLLETSWYNGGWNQFFPPLLANVLLALLAGISIFAAGRAFLRGRLFGSELRGRFGVPLFGAALAGLLAVLLVARETTQAQGRTMYVGLSAFALLAVIGLAEATDPPPRYRRLALAVWPLALLALNLYVLWRFVIPFRGL